MDEMQDMIVEFLADCSENLEEFENNLLDLEKTPDASSIVDSMFRQIHSIKGASGFLSFSNLESLTHKAENVLDLLRQSKGSIDQSLISTFLDVCDAMKSMFGVIQEQGNDGDQAYADLKARLLNYESSFKTGAPLPAAKPTEAVSEAITESTLKPTQESSEQEPELDALQIEMLKSLGMYNEETSKTENTAEPEPELDALQIEMLKSLGAYDNKSNNSTPTPVAAVTPSVKAEDKPAEKAPVASATAGSPLQKKETIRVDVDTLDKLMNFAGELVLVRNQLLELAKTNSSQAFDQSFTTLDMVTGEIQRSLMATRMQPISTVWSKMPRIVRDLAAQLGRDIQLLMQGENTELDKTIIEAISDPMTHIIRNCCDHGIEDPADREAAGKSKRGTIKLVAEHRGNWIHVDVIDDGKGISRAVLRKKALEKGIHTQEELDAMDDQAILNIIFHAGFSTKDQASTISGRGVGMDVIRSNINKINGTVELQSIEGKGTHLKMKLPLTLAILPAVIVSVHGNKYAIPQNTVQEVAIASKESIEHLDNIGGQKFTRLRGKILPLVFARDFLEQNHTVSDSVSSAESINFVVINADGYTYGLVIDKVLDIIEIVVKPLDSGSDFRYYAGATIMGDGKVALILDANKIAELSNIDKNSADEGLHEAIQSTMKASDLTLLFKLRNNKNYLIPLSKTSRIEEIDKSNIEHRQIGTFAKFNGRVIRIINLMSLLNLEPDPQCDWLDKEDSIKTLYFEFFGHGIAIDVGFNHLLLQEAFDIEDTHSSEFIAGTALIDNEVFEVLNLEDYLGQMLGTLSEKETETVVKVPTAHDTKKLLGFDDQTTSVISFKLGTLHFGLELNSVSEIMATEEVTPTPGSRESIDGLLNLRGEIMISRSLKDILSLDASSQADYDSELSSNRSLIVNDGQNKVCLRIGKVDEILNLNKEDFSIAPNNIPNNILSCLKGVYKLNGSMLLLLDEKKLITDVVVEAK